MARKTRKQKSRPLRPRQFISLSDVRRAQSITASPRWYSFYGAILSLCILAYFLVPLFTQNNSSQIPATEFLVPQRSLSGLPVLISEVSSCGCWSGPRGQADLKFKFILDNHAAESLDIGGGAESVVRLIVAYPNWYTPRVEGPIGADTENEIISDDDPANAITYAASRIGRIAVTKLTGKTTFFAAPKHFTVWAIPPNLNKVTEPMGDNQITFPTYVTEQPLGPNERYSDNRKGFGDWVFYLPEPKQIQRRVNDGSSDTKLPQALTGKYIVIIGVAVLDKNNGLLGFAPAPTQNQLLDPNKF